MNEFHCFITPKNEQIHWCHMRPHIFGLEMVGLSGCCLCVRLDSDSNWTCLFSSRFQKACSKQCPSSQLIGRIFNSFPGKIKSVSLILMILSKLLPSDQNLQHKWFLYRKYMHRKMEGHSTLYLSLSYSLFPHHQRDQTPWNDLNARKSARGSTTPRREHSEGPVRVSRADAP